MPSSKEQCLRCGNLVTYVTREAGNAATWVHARLAQPFTFKRGKQYRLWFASPQSASAAHCYLHHPVYGPGDDGTNWCDTSWGGRKGCLIYEKGQQWVHVTTHDLSFSLRTGEE